MPKTQAADLSTRVLRLRLKDKHAAWRRARAAEVNLGWNCCNEVSRNLKKRGLQWLEKEFAAAGEARADEPAVNEGRPSGLTEAGHGLPAVGIPALKEGEDVKSQPHIQRKSD